MTTLQPFASTPDTGITNEQKRRQRRSKVRGRLVNNDVVVLPILPSLFLLLLLSETLFPRNDAFQFKSIQKTTRYCNSAKSTIHLLPRASGNAFLGPGQQRTTSFGNTAISLSSPSIDSRSESGNNNSTEIISSDRKSSSKEPPLPGTKENEETLSADSAMAEAANLRALAKELRAEARVMELDLKQRASKQQQEKDKVTDELIEALFLPLQYSYKDPQKEAFALSIATTTNTGTTTETDTESKSEATPKKRIPDARVVADRLRQGKVTREQFIAVVDRLFEQHVDLLNGAIEQDPGTFKSQELEGTEHKMDRVEVLVDGRHFDYLQVLTSAANFLDLTFKDIATKLLSQPSTTTPTSSSTPQEAVWSSPAAPYVPLSSPSLSSSNSSSSTPSSSTSPSSFTLTPPFVTSGKVAKAIQSRMDQLRQSKKGKYKRNIEEARNKVVSVSSSLGPPYKFIMGEKTNATAVAAATTTNELSGETPSFIPLWIPASYIPYIVSLNKKAKGLIPKNTTGVSNATKAVVPFAIVHNSTLDRSELETLKNEVLLGSRFYVTSFEFAPGAALFRGNIRTSLGSLPALTASFEKSSNRTSTVDNNTAMVFADIQDRLKTAGLEDKVQLFVLPDPEAIRRIDAAASQYRASRRPHIEASVDPHQEPVVLALPKNLTPDESKLEKGWIRKIGKRLSYPIAAMSMFSYSLKAFALNPHFFDALVIQRDATVLRYCIPLVVGFISVQVIHEVAHYIVAKRKKIKIGFPVPIATPFYSNLPFFGCITPLRSFPPNRAALVDFALSGPMASLAVSLCMVLGGVALTSRASAGQIARFPFLSVHAMKSNFLLGTILSWLLPKTMMLPLAQPIPMHPLFVIGRFGMISSALNLLPIFRLDGGRACFAVLGQRQGAVISAFTILWIISSFFMSSSMLLIWTLMVALFQMRVEIPCRDECTKVGLKREFLWFFSFMLSMSILVPFPHRGMH